MCFSKQINDGITVCYENRSNYLNGNNFATANSWTTLPHCYQDLSLRAPPTHNIKGFCGALICWEENTEDNRTFTFGSDSTCASPCPQKPQVIISLTYSTQHPTQHPRLRSAFSRLDQFDLLINKSRNSGGPWHVVCSL